MSLSFFTKLSNLITVSENKNPLSSDLLLSHDMKLEYAIKFIEHEAPEHILGSHIGYLIENNGTIVGITTLQHLEEVLDNIDIFESTHDLEFFPEHDLEPVLEDIMIHITPDSIISANTTVYYATQLLASGKDILLIIDGNTYTGFIVYEDLFKMPFRVCLFALVAELEQLALKLIKQNTLESWNCLADKRKEKAIQTFFNIPSKNNLVDKLMGVEYIKNKVKNNIDNNNIDDSDASILLDNTTFIDKNTILKKRNLIPCISNSKIDKIFNKAQTLRDSCAHPKSENDILINKHEYMSIITDIHKLRIEIIKAGKMEDIEII